ncbi:MAG: hypothetical protein SGI71_04335, partial [Verrucomicrobiota bacterium]|nr:hypothetical protein [Verrucomicrobiota bacterium]
VGGGAGYAVSNGDPYVTMGGAAGGALLGSLLAGPNKKRERQVYNSGYDRGRADALKRHYWLHQRSQASINGSASGRTVYYTVPARNQTGEEGITKMPHSVTIPVVE